jgi:hypothetical protein
MPGCMADVDQLQDGIYNGSTASAECATPKKDEKFKEQRDMRYFMRVAVVSSDFN